MIIRNERFEDYSRVEEVAREAFWNLYIPGATEHVVVNKMRNHPDFIKELAFVIEINGIVEGAIFYTHSKIVLADNSEYKTISFGPVFIAPKWHRQGLGRALITYSIEIAKNMGFSVITTLGYPYHYNPYGFVGGKKYGISMADGNFYKGLLVLPLVDNILSNIKGYALFSESLEVTENEVNEFEKVLPYKEKKFQPSQLEYQLACQELEQ